MFCAKIRGFEENCKKKPAEKFGGFLGRLFYLYLSVKTENGNFYKDRTRRTEYPLER